LIIVLNGYPGVGKLTIGQELVARIKGRLLDIHSVYNIPFASTEFKSPKFIEAAEKIEAIAHDLGPVDKVWQPYLCGGQGEEC
jgi:tRNA uridine 5-carbamoylmethylation protein Kti12